jgi:hypothetical protein
MDFLRRACAKVVGLFKGRSSRRRFQHEEKKATPRSSMSSHDARWQREVEHDAWSQDIRAYLANNGFNVRSTYDIRACVDNDARSICSVVCFNTRDRRFDPMSPNLNPFFPLVLMHQSGGLLHGQTRHNPREERQKAGPRSAVEILFSQGPALPKETLGA